MSNLPVLWVPPVAPPDPDERPPKRRGNRGVLAAAVAIVGLPLLAIAVYGAVGVSTEMSEPATAHAAPSSPVAARPATVVEATPVALPKAAPSRLTVATGPSPETSGGNQPYIAAPPTPTPPASPAPSPTVEAPKARAAVGADGRPVRVIGIDRPSADMAQGEPARAIPERRTKDDAAPAPATVATPITPATPRGSIDGSMGAAAGSTPAPVVTTAEPDGPIAAKPAPVVAPSAPAKPTVVEAPAAPQDAPSVVRVGPPEAGAVVREPPAPVTAKPAEATTPQSVAPPATTAEAKPRPVPLPPKRATAPAERREVDGAGTGDFADRLAAIRRAESRRAVEARKIAPPVDETDEEVIVVAPRRPWGWVPPFFQDRPRGPVLRPYEAPPRTVSERDLRGENCHYHAWPTDEMAFHRSVRCHWHRDPEDPSIRYVR